MAERAPSPWDDFVPAPAALAAPSSPWADFTPTAAPETEFDRRFRGEETPSPGFLRRLAGDIGGVFMEGVHSTIDAPNPDLGPEHSELTTRMMTNLIAQGVPEAQAKRQVDNVTASMRRGKFMLGTLFGPLTALSAPVFGPARTLATRPISEATGVPLEAVEQLAIAGLAGVGLGIHARTAGRVPGGEKPTTPNPEVMAGELKDAASFLGGVEDATFMRQPRIGGPTESIGGLPKAEDFKAASEALGAPPVQEGFVRFYHGGDEPASGGPRWVTTDPEYARNFRAEGQPKEVHYVDVPRGDPVEVAARAWDAIDEQGQTNMVGRYNAIEVPEGWAKKLQPFGRDLVEGNLRRLWEEDGIHPAEAAHDALADPVLRERLSQPLPPADIEPPLGEREQIPVFHATDAEFERFDVGKARNKYEQAVFFGISEGDVAGYGKNVKPAWLEGSGLHVDQKMFEHFAARGDPVKGLLDYAKGQHFNKYVFFDLDNVKYYAVFDESAIRHERPAEQAKPGDHRIDSMLDNPTVRRNIDEAVIDRTHDVPGGALTSKGLDDRTIYIDKRVPREMEIGGVKFDPAEPLTIRETVAQHVTEELVQGGMDKETAAKIAETEYAAKAEDAWYRAHKIDPAKAREAIGPMERESPRNPPRDAREKPEPKAEPLEDTEPTPGEIAQAKEIMDRANGALDENGIPERGLIVPPAALPSPGGPLGGAVMAGPVLQSGLPNPPGPGIGGRPPPPPPPPRGGVPAGPGGPYRRPPYFTYDDSHPVVKFLRGSVDAWIKTFQPELFSDLSRQAEPFFAEHKSREQMLHDQIIRNGGEESYQFWRAYSDAERIQFYDLYENGQRMPTPEWQRERDITQGTFDFIYNQYEPFAGSKADYFTNYFSHLFKDPLQARDWVAGRVAQFGSKWFQKERSFATIKEAMEAGLRLKSTNPADLVQARLFASVNMVERMHLLHNMHAMDLAKPLEEATAERSARFDQARQLGLPIDINTVGRDLLDEGWMPINAPDGKQWIIAPDIRPLWENAFAPGLWGMEGRAGRYFQNYMAVKNTYVPIKLALSGFHPLHVAHISMAADMARIGRELGWGNFGAIAETAKWSPYDVGRTARSFWHIPEDQRTPTQSLIVKTMNEGGLVAEMSEQLRISGQRSLEAAWDNSQYGWMLPLGLREGIRRMQAPVFEQWIPNLKVGHYMRDVADFFTHNPAIWNDPVQRRVALRTIAKSTEDRFGEMFYGGVFVNRYVKDAAIGAFLSAGWQTGLVRQSYGGFVAPFQRLIRGAVQGHTPTEETIMKADTRPSYVFMYVANSMLLAGITTLAMTGEMPEELDYFLPRTGRLNPDGTPHRLTHMSYTREYPMLKKHIEEEGGNIFMGVANTVQSKLVIGPALELLRNRDYYGNEIWSERNPYWKRGVYEIAPHILKENLTPISFNSAQEAFRSGGGWGEAALSGFGFGPAPAYADRTATQNRIAFLFREHVAPLSRPAEAGLQAKDRRDIRAEIMLAQQRGDQKAVQEGSDKWFKAGGSSMGLSNIILGVSSDIGMFKALPQQYQEDVLASATPQERERYNPFRTLHLTSKLADFYLDAEKARKQGNLPLAQEFDRKSQALMDEAVKDGRITNPASFKANVAKEMMMRIAPDAGAQRSPMGRLLMRHPEINPGPIIPKQPVPPPGAIPP